MDQYDGLVCKKVLDRGRLNYLIIANNLLFFQYYYQRLYDGRGTCYSHYGSISSSVGATRGTIGAPVHNVRMLQMRGCHIRGATYTLHGS